MSDPPPPNPASVAEGSSFVEMLWLLYERKETGVLQLRAEDVLTVVYVRRGMPVSVEAGILGQTIGRVMLDQEMITEAQYHEIIERMTEQLFHDEHVRFGEVAVALGFLTLEQINLALAEQVRQRVMHCMQWEEPTFRFKPKADALEGIAPYPCSVEPLILDGIRRYYESDRLVATLQPVAQLHVKLARSLAEIGGRFSLSSGELRVLRRVDGSRTVAAVLSADAADELQAKQLLTALLLTKQLELGPRPLASTESAADVVVPPKPRGGLRPRFASGDVPLQASPTASTPEAPPAGAAAPVAADAVDLPTPVEAAPGAALPAPVPGGGHTALPDVRRAKPEAVLPGRPASAELPAAKPAAPPASPGVAVAHQQDASPPPDAASKAAEPDSDRFVSTPPPVDVQRRRLLAERSFRDGKKSLRHGRRKQALEQLRRAHELHPEAVEYELYTSWAELCLMTDPDQAAERRGDLEVLVRKALGEDRRFAFAHDVRGQIALADREHATAAKAFARAMKLDPSDDDAKRHFVIARRRMEG